MEELVLRSWVQVWNNLNGGNCWRKVKKHDKIKYLFMAN